MKRAFTLVELVLVVTILGILAISALPNFIDMAEDEKSPQEAVAGSVRAGIALFRANDLVSSGPPGIYPQALDTVANGSACSAKRPCFGNVIANGVSDRSWRKINATTYAFNDGVTKLTFQYDIETGAFKPVSR